MTVELFNNGTHKCFSYGDLVTGGDAVQSNQFLIIDNGHAALLDPGGELTYNRLYMHITNEINVQLLDYVIASHQDPDILASLNKWVLGTDCKFAVAKLWERFIPHFCKTSGKTDKRVLAIPDEGTDILLGNSVIKALPAHFLHSEGNFHFYDPISKILFSGDLGASLTHGGGIEDPVVNFEAHIPHLQPFHQRLMVSNKILRFWVNMVRTLELEWIVPQHGPAFKGEKVIHLFLDWLESLPCGIDLMTQNHYKIPGK